MRAHDHLLGSGDSVRQLENQDSQNVLEEGWITWGVARPQCEVDTAGRQEE